MREYQIAPKDEGKRLDRWLRAELPAVSMGQLQKLLRLKRIKLNGKPAQGETRLHEGDELKLYIGEECFERPVRTDPFLSKLQPKLDIVYEDDNILLVDKRPGLVTHPDEEEKVHTLITYVQAYLYQKGEYDSMAEHAFAPVLCNRIDRFTGGIVLIAKTEAAMHVLNEKLRTREIEKHYLCVIHGRMRPPEGTISNYILKNTKRVTVLKKNAPGAQAAQTRYRTLETREKLSLMDCELLTGRTHQIRAQFADAGHPLLGDTQYGNAELNARYRQRYQALYAYRVVFAFTTDAGVLQPLNGRSWHVKTVPFVKEYFGEQREDRQGPAADRPRPPRQERPAREDEAPSPERSENRPYRSSDRRAPAAGRPFRQEDRRPDAEHRPDRSGARRPSDAGRPDRRDGQGAGKRGSRRETTGYEEEYSVLPSTRSYRSEWRGRPDRQSAPEGAEDTPVRGSRPDRRRHDR